MNMNDDESNGYSNANEMRSKSSHREQNFRQHSCVCVKQGQAAMAMVHSHTLRLRCSSATWRCGWVLSLC